MPDPVLPDLPHLVIVGGGASCVLLLYHLVFEAVLPCRITVFEPSGVVGQGLAYQTQDPGHLLNVRASGMSALPDDPTHFCRWLSDHKTRWQLLAPAFAYYHPTPDDFVPRMIYAAYLAHLWQTLLAQAHSQGHQVQVVPQAVVSIDSDMTVNTATGPAVQADAVVLATGNARLCQPAGQPCLTPWELTARHLDGAKQVVVMGTGLSLIDTLVTLDGLGYTGPVTAISRRGLLPHAHQPHDIPASVLQPPQAATRQMVRTMRQAAKQTGNWQGVVDSVRGVTNVIWQQLPPGEQKRVNRVMPYWSVHRHRMAPENAALVERMALTCIKGEVLSVEHNQVTVKSPLGQITHYPADVIVNALGYMPQHTPLFKTLLAQGIVQPHATTGYALSAELPVFGIGPVLGKHFFETTAIPDIRQQAKALASDLCHLLEKTHPDHNVRPHLVVADL